MPCRVLSCLIMHTWRLLSQSVSRGLMHVCIHHPKDQPIHTHISHPSIHHHHSLALAFSIVDYSLPITLPSSSTTTTAFIRRRGLCTTWLESVVAAPFLSATAKAAAEEGGGGRTSENGSGSGSGVAVPIFLKPAKEFVLPGACVRGWVDGCVLSQHGRKKKERKRVREDGTGVRYSLPLSSTHPLTH